MSMQGEIRVLACLFVIIAAAVCGIMYKLGQIHDSVADIQAEQARLEYRVLQLEQRLHKLQFEHDNRQDIKTIIDCDKVG